VTHLRQIMLEELERRNYAPSTIHAYNSLMPLKRDAPAELIAKVGILEDRCDRWGENCSLFRRKWNLAAWHALTLCARSLELGAASTDRGGPKHRLTATNLSRVAFQLYKAAKKHGYDGVGPRSQMFWNLPEEMLKQARDEAFSYSMCCADFPGWHQNIYSVTDTSESSIAFDALATERIQRVMAYEKGFRPARLRRKSSSPNDNVSEDVELRDLLAEVTKSVKPNGRFGFSLPCLNKLHAKLKRLYLGKIELLFRRSPNIALGGYTMEDFRVFTASLLAIAGAREYLCFAWMTMGHQLPCDDLVLLETRIEWIDDLSSLSGLSAHCVGQMIADLTLKDDNSNCDIYVSPFIPLDDKGDWLAIVPGFIVIANSEEAILRNRAAHNKRFSDAASNSKEDETREELRNALPAMNIWGPLKLDKGMPDVDLIIEDQKTNTLLIAELKWLQLPVFVRVRDKRNEELIKGTRQIGFIRDFLTARPNYFVKDGRMSKSLDEYSEVKYCVLCRDYIADLGSNGTSLFSYSALKTVLEDEKDLSVAVAYMTSDEWLPKKSEDFLYARSPYRCNGVTLRTNLFRTTYDENLNRIDA
jgi:hypothetical protein